MAQPLHLLLSMSTPRNVRLVCLALALATFGGGCGGGPLSHTVDNWSPSAVSAEERSKVDAKQSVVEEAAGRKNATVVAVEQAEAKVSQAESAVEQAEANLEVAEAKLELAEKQGEAGQTVDVAGAKGELAKAQKALEIAEKQRDVAEKSHTLAEKDMNEAERAWVVALADLELTKFLAQGGQGAGFDEEKANFEKQLADAQSKHANAKRDQAQAKQEVEKAQAELAAVSGS